MSNLDDLFGIEPNKAVVPVGTTTSVADIQSDFDMARDNLVNAAIVAQEALLDTHKVALTMQNAKTYDSLAKMIAAVVMVNKGVLELHKNKQDVTGVVAQTDQPVGATIMLTTAQLHDYLDNAAAQSRITDAEFVEEDD